MKAYIPVVLSYDYQRSAVMKKVYTLYLNGARMPDTPTCVAIQQSLAYIIVISLSRIPDTPTCAAIQQSVEQNGPIQLISPISSPSLKVCSKIFSFNFKVLKIK